MRSESSLYETLTLPIVSFSSTRRCRFVHGAVPVSLTNGTQFEVSPCCEPGSDPGTPRSLQSVSPLLPLPLNPSPNPKYPCSEFSASNQRRPPVTTQLVGDVVGQLAEDRLVAIDALLLRQPDRVGPARHLEIRRQIVDLVTLLDVVHLSLREHAADEAQPIFRRRREAQLMGIAPIAILALDVLRDVDGVAVIVVEVRAERASGRRIATSYQYE